MKILTNYIYRCAAAAFLAISLTGCLEKLPGDYIHESEGMKTFSDAEQTLVGIYSAYKSNALYSGYLTLCPDIQADLVYAVKGNTNTYGRFWQWTVRSTDSEIEAVYAQLYTVIGRCNFFLEQVGELKKSLTDDNEITVLENYTGQVYCARALAYSELIKCYCKAYDQTTADEPDGGVVLRTKWTEKERVKRSTLRESYELVISDLEKAESLLDADKNGYDAPVFTKAAAKAIRARVALYTRDWETAVKYATDVIDTKVGDLKAFDLTNARTSEFNNLWSTDSGVEIIWKVNFTVTSYGGALGSVFLNLNRDRVYFYPDYVPAEDVLKLYTSGDLRYSSYFATVQTGYESGLECPVLKKYYGNTQFLSNYIYHVCMPKPLRLAEQYLIRAEAYAQMGEYGKAGADLTKLRQSRFSTGGNISVNADNWNDVISQERVRELYMEGFRLHDLKRWGRGFERTPQAESQDEGSSLKISKDNALFVWPIPRNEIEAQGSEIVQNPSN